MNSKRRDLYKKEIRFEIDSNTMSYLEALHFDFVGYEHIMKNILLQHKDNQNYTYNEETCKIFMDRYRDIARKYNILKSEIISAYAPEEYKNSSLLFDFESECIIVDDKISGCVGDSCRCK